MMIVIIMTTVMTTTNNTHHVHAHTHNCSHCSFKDNSLQNNAHTRTHTHTHTHHTHTHHTHIHTHTHTEVKGFSYAGQYKVHSIHYLLLLESTNTMEKVESVVQ